jgi:hypothetical protein
MARGFRRRGKGASLRYAAKLDPAERAAVAGLMEQVRDLVAPEEPEPEPGESADPFDAIVSGLGGLGMGVSLSAEDQAQWPARAPAPPDSRSFGVRDPALERLLPSANREDEQAAAEFRRLTEDGLRRRKAANLERSIAALSGPSDAVELTAPDALAFLVALTDVRLVLGERLELRDDTDLDRLAGVAAEAPDDALAYALAVYDFLTWLQETLATALDAEAHGGEV